ncbi:hypothetical protein ABID62_003349 [Bradyrhizobium sp. S3.9.1]
MFIAFGSFLVAFDTALYFSEGWWAPLRHDWR